jgi:hypothetical protein
MNDILFLAIMILVMSVSYGLALVFDRLMKQ